MSCALMGKNKINVVLLNVSVKVLEKRHIVREKKVQYVSREKEVLSRLNHPFFVRLYFTFQDKEKLCILPAVCWGLGQGEGGGDGITPSLPPSLPS